MALAMACVHYVGHRRRAPTLYSPASWLSFCGALSRKPLSLLGRPEILGSSCKLSGKPCWKKASPLLTRVCDPCMDPMECAEQDASDSIFFFLAYLQQWMYLVILPLHKN